MSINFNRREKCGARGTERAPWLDKERRRDGYRRYIERLGMPASKTRRIAEPLGTATRNDPKGAPYYAFLAF